MLAVEDQLRVEPLAVVVAGPVRLQLVDARTPPIDLELVIPHNHVEAAAVLLDAIVHLLLELLNVVVDDARLVSAQGQPVQDLLPDAMVLGLDRVPDGCLAPGP